MGSTQIHDFNPGIADNGLFWTAPIPRRAVRVNPGSGLASMHVESLAVPDYHDLINALLEGPSLPGVVSFHIEWARSPDRRHFHNEALQYDGKVVINTAMCEWSGRTTEARFVSHPANTSVTVYAEVGHVRNGVFFP